MTVNPDKKPVAAEGAEDTGVRTVVAGAVVILLLASGWFAWSHFALHTAVFDAVAEALGVAFGLLVFGSAIGAALAARSRRQ